MMKTGINIYFTSKKEIIGRNLFLIRKAIGYNHYQLCELTGLTRPILSNIENFSGNPTLDTLSKIENALFISSDLFYLTHEKFWNFRNLFKSVYELEKKLSTEMLIPEKYWYSLLKLSGCKSKIDQGKISQICYKVIDLNFNKFDCHFNNIVLGSILGVIYQNDGFKDGFEFGAWLGNKLYL